MPQFALLARPARERRAAVGRERGRSTHQARSALGVRRAKSRGKDAGWTASSVCRKAACKGSTPLGLVIVGRPRRDLLRGGSMACAGEPAKSTGAPFANLQQRKT